MIFILAQLGCRLFIPVILFINSDSAMGSMHGGIFGEALGMLDNFRRS